MFLSKTLPDQHWSNPLYSLIMVVIPTNHRARPPHWLHSFSYPFAALRVTLRFSGPPDRGPLESVRLGTNCGYGVGRFTSKSLVTRSNLPRDTILMPKCIKIPKCWGNFFHIQIWACVSGPCSVSQAS